MKRKARAIPVDTDTFKSSRERCFYYLGYFYRAIVWKKETVDGEACRMLRRFMAAGSHAIIEESDAPTEDSPEGLGRYHKPELYVR